MANFSCNKCGYIYSEEDGCEEVFEAEVQNELIKGYIRDQDAKCEQMGVIPGSKWADIPKDFVCPMCGAGKDAFELESESEA